MGRAVGLVGVLAVCAALGCFGGSDGSGAAGGPGDGGEVPGLDEGSSGTGGAAGAAGSAGASGGSGAAGGEAGSGGGGGGTGGIVEAPRCVPGQTNACVCAGGVQGVQTCEPSGTYAPCECTSSPPVAECVPGEQSTPGMPGDPCPQTGTSCATATPPGVAVATCQADGTWGTSGCMCIPGPSDCTAANLGEGRPCLCGSAPVGMQTCQADGAWSACICPSADAGVPDAGGVDAGATDGGTSTRMACTSSTECGADACCDMLLLGGLYCTMIPGFCYCVPAISCPGSILP